MKTRACPRCQHNALISTGAFWLCQNCFYAITHAALLFDLTHAREQLRQHPSARR